MSREEAIRIIKIVLAVAEDFEITVQGEEFTEEKCKEAVEMVIKALDQEQCEDCISRLSIINKLEILMDMYVNDVYLAVRKIIDAEPSIQPKHRMGRWIDADGDNARCGCCNRLNHLYGTYCKHCGAKMQEVDSDVTCEM